jgi:hypothetical protein
MVEMSFSASAGSGPCHENPERALVILYFSLVTAFSVFSA